jgi:peptide deformylase
MVLVNPRIVTAEGEIETEEGCLSVRALRSKVTRSAKVTVQARDLEGREVTLDADDLLAVCLQHEIDHLDGALFIDRISRLKRVLYDKKVEKWEKRKAAGSA